MRLLLFCFALCSAICAHAQQVVINKYYVGPSTPQQDVVELLVVQAGTDLRGVVIKDFSSSMGADGGGKYNFANHSLWQSLAAGTLVVISNNTSSTDVDASDGLVAVALGDANYFTYRGGTWDLSSTDMVMLKQAGSDVAGVVGAIHTLASGVAGSNYTAASAPKLLAATATLGGAFCAANNSNSVLADYDGSDATGNASGLVFGTGNTPANMQYIQNLRGVALVTSVDSLQFGNVQVGSNATLQYQVTGTALAGSIRVSSTQASVFLVSATGSTFADTTLLPPTGGPVFVRFVPSAAGSYSASITHSSGSISKQVQLRGVGNAAPQPSIQFTSSAPDFGQVALGTQPVLSIGVAGSNLSTNIVCTSSDTVLTLSNNQVQWGSAAQLPAAGGTLWLRLTPTAQQHYQTSVTATSGSAQQVLGVQGTGVWNASMQAVVINKMLNASIDAVELLVLQHNTNLQGLMLKDFSDNMQGDAGGKYRFANHPLWQSLRAGTLIILRANASAADTDASDWVLDVGLDNGNYFTNLDPSGVFDIAGNELVMVKRSDAALTGNGGCIHALAGGTTGSYWQGLLQPRLLATTGLGVGQYVMATTPTSQLHEFNGSTALGGQTGLTLGQGNNTSNQVLINALRTPTANDPEPVGHNPSQLRYGPNPTTGTLVVQLPSAYALRSWQCYNTAGQVVHLPAQQVNETLVADLRGLPPGRYTLLLHSRQEHTYTIAFVVVR